MCGKPKAGKSTLAKYLIRCILFGKDFLGRKSMKGNVMLLSGEDVAPALAKEFEDLKGTVEGDRFLINSKLLQMGDTKKLVKTVNSFEPLLIIIDTLGGIPGLGDINDYANTRRALGVYEGLAQTTNSHILFIHHANKNRESKGGDSMLGSTAIRGIGYANIFVDKQNENRTISSECRYGKPIEKSRLVYDFTTKEYQTYSVEEFDIVQLKKDVLALLSDGTAAFSDDMRKSLGVRNDSLVKALKEMEAEGSIKSFGKGSRGSPKSYSVAEPRSPH